MYKAQELQVVGNVVVTEGTMLLIISQVISVPKGIAFALVLRMQIQYLHVLYRRLTILTNEIPLFQVYKFLLVDLVFFSCCRG